MAERKYVITGHVARLLTDDELVINKGFLQIVKINMIFDVIDPRSVDITDPISGENLGSLNRVVAQVRIMEVAERLSRARIVPERRGSALSETARVLAGVPAIPRLTSDVWPEGVKEGDPVGYGGEDWTRRPRTVGEQAREQLPKGSSES